MYLLHIYEVVYENHMASLVVMEIIHEKNSNDISYENTKVVRKTLRNRPNEFPVSSKTSRGKKDKETSIKTYKRQPGEKLFPIQVIYG